MPVVVLVLPLFPIARLSMQPTTSDLYHIRVYTFETRPLQINLIQQNLMVPFGAVQFMLALGTHVYLIELERSRTPWLDLQ